MKEPVFETANLALYEIKKGFEIHLNGLTHAVLIGNPKSFERGKRFMEAAEKNIKNLRDMYRHY